MPLIAITAGMGLSAFALLQSWSLIAAGRGLCGVGHFFESWGTPLTLLAIGLLLAAWGRFERAHAQSSDVRFTEFSPASAAAAEPAPVGTFGFWCRAHRAFGFHQFDDRAVIQGQVGHLLLFAAAVAFGVARFAYCSFG